MGGGQVLGDRGEVIKEALVGEQEIGAEVMVQTEGMLQTVVRHQERPALWDHGKTENKVQVIQFCKQYLAENVQQL